MLVDEAVSVAKMKFQFLIVRLKYATNAANVAATKFQFLIVRLKLLSQ